MANENEIGSTIRGAYVQLRASWRSIQPARSSSGPRTGRIRPAVTFRWTRLGQPIRRDRPSAASAPWLA